MYIPLLSINVPDNVIHNFAQYMGDDAKVGLQLLLVTRLYKSIRGLERRVKDDELRLRAYSEPALTLRILRLQCREITESGNEVPADLIERLSELQQTVSDNKAKASADWARLERRKKIIQCIKNRTDYKVFASLYERDLYSRSRPDSY